MRYSLNLSWWRSWYEAGSPQHAIRVLEDYDLPVKTEQHGATLTLIDFDDTLFPTTALRDAGVNARVDSIDEISTSLADDVRRCEREAVLLIRAAQDAGTVKVVTVASAAWVYLAVRNLMPTLATYIDEDILQSARDDFQEYEQGRPEYWKYWAFKEQLDRFPNTELDVVVIGDGYPERWAAYHVALELGNDGVVKVVEIWPSSSISRLTAQLAFTTSSFELLDETYDALNIEYVFD